MKDATKTEKSSLYKAFWIFLFGLIFLSLPSFLSTESSDSRHFISGGVSFLLIAIVLMSDHFFNLKLIKKLIPYILILYFVFYYTFLSIINIFFKA